MTTRLSREEVERYAALGGVWPPRVHELSKALLAAWDALEEATQGLDECPLCYKEGGLHYEYCKLAKALPQPKDGE